MAWPHGGAAAVQARRRERLPRLHNLPDEGLKLGVRDHLRCNGGGKRASSGDELEREIISIVAAVLAAVALCLVLGLAALVWEILRSRARRLSPDGGAVVLATRTVAGMRQLPAAELEQIAPEGGAAEHQSEL